jgi:hypothetical protein
LSVRLCIISHTQAYQRKGAVLLQTGKYAEALETLQKGLSFEQPTATTTTSGASTAIDNATKPNANTQPLLSLMASARKAPKMDAVVPRGVVAQVPVAYHADRPHAINFDAYADSIVFFFFFFFF